MLLAGSDDGVYRIDGLLAGRAEPTRVLESERVFRVEQFPELPGVFAATASGLFHSPGGETWTRLPVPTDATVNAVGATQDGERLFIGTFPERLFVLEDASSYFEASTGGPLPDAEDWREPSGFRDHAAAGEWGLQRHDFQAHVRSIQTHPAASDRVVVGVEVGGVHVSEDRGETWTERGDGTHDDVHHLAIGGPETLVTATGYGLYRSDDAGRSWTRLDDELVGDSEDMDADTDGLDGSTDDPDDDGADSAADDERREYFRESLVYDGDVYAGAAHGPSPTWPDDDDPRLFVSRADGSVESISSPVSEVVIGWTVAKTEDAGDETVIGVTYAGTILRARADALADESSAGGDEEMFDVVGEVPTTDEVRGRYLPLTWVDD